MTSVIILIMATSTTPLIDSEKIPELRLELYHAPPGLPHGLLIEKELEVEGVQVPVGSWFMWPATAAFIELVLTDYYEMPARFEAQQEILDDTWRKIVKGSIAYARADERAKVLEHEAGYKEWHVVALVLGTFVAAGGACFVAGLVAGLSAN